MNKLSNKWKKSSVSWIFNIKNDNLLHHLLVKQRNFYSVNDIFNMLDKS